MQTSFSFCDESNPSLAGVCIWNEATINGRSAHFGLLSAFPAVGMAEDNLKFFLHSTPQGRAIGVCVGDEILCAPEEIAKVISKDLNGRFAFW
jgi:hypothetical protein